MRKVAEANAEAAAAAAAPNPATRILIRRAWVGAPPSSEVDAQMKFYQSYAAKTAQQTWGDDEMATGQSGEEVAERLASLLDASGCNALNLRLHVQGAEASLIREQIEGFGSDVLPVLRERIAALSD